MFLLRRKYLSLVISVIIRFQEQMKTLQILFNLLSCNSLDCKLSAKSGQKKNWKKDITIFYIAQINYD
jgi:hypothetical protein